MLKMKLKHLKPGMVLSKDVTNFSGVLLLKSGRPLQPRDIKNFKAWGIVEAFVQEAPSQSARQDDDSRVDPKLLKAAQAECAVLFRHANSDHPIVIELQRLCTLNKVHRKSVLEGSNEY